MTERLSTLLHDEASALAVPPPPAHDVLVRGRTLRRHRRLRTGAAVVTVVAVLGVGLGLGLATGGGDHDARGIDPAGPSTGHGAVFSLGTTVYWDGGEQHVAIDDKAIKSTYYTSAGLLVRHGNNNSSDGGGPQRFSLVTPDGAVKPVSVVTEESVPGVDPTQPYLAYTEVKDDQVQVVVHDVSTDEEVARVTMPGSFEWGGWSGPPVALSGDTVYVGTDDVMRTVDWRTGEIGETDTVPGGYPDIDGGRAVVSSGDPKGGTARVVDVETGDTLLTVQFDAYGYLTLSPDGRFAVNGAEDGSFDVYDIEAGTHLTFQGQAYDYGWSPDGDLFTVKAQHVVTCSTASGECTTGSVEIPKEGGGMAPDDLRYGNQTFES
ncbi:MAG: hypothetical protein JWO76_2140 [Nocardioides sp.]|nr:hypothetical protein [Nocardioides sp.]